MEMIWKCTEPIFLIDIVLPYYDLLVATLHELCPTDSSCFYNTDIPFFAVFFAANIIVGSGSIFGRLFPFSLDNQSNPVYLSPLQVRCRGNVYISVA